MLTDSKLMKKWHESWRGWMIILSAIGLFSAVAFPQPALDKAKVANRIGATRISSMSEDKLLRMRDEQDDRSIRKHAWSSFARMTARAHAPIWQSWSTKCDVKLASLGCDAKSQKLPTSLRGFEYPAQFLEAYRTHDRHDTLLHFNFSDLVSNFSKLPELASVRFNPEAKRHILDTQIYSYDGLAAILKDRRQHVSPPAETEIPPFPVGSVVVKTAWEIVTQDFSSGIPNPPHTIQAYDPNKSEISNRPGGGDLQRFPIDAGSRTEINTDRNIKCEDHDYTAAVPISCFHYIKIETADQLNSLGSLVSVVTGSQRPPFYMVLVAVHVTTKEIPEWTWSTFYWSNKAFDRDARENRDRPPTIRGRWRHFSMNTTLSAESPLGQKTMGPNICYNPYLEGRFEHGASSNCLFCHRFASFVPTEIRRPSFEIVGSPPYIDGRRVEQADEEAQFLRNALKTDFLWSLSGVNQSTLQDFEKGLRLHLDSVSISRTVK